VVEMGGRIFEFTTTHLFFFELGSRMLVS
jgi:hypothetical protein